MSAAITRAGDAAPAATRPGFAEAVRVWLKIGCLGFGGPAGQIALMHRILVDEKRWLDEATYLRALNLCMLLPGPEAQQLATYAGWRLHGVPGGLAAGGLFVLPGFLLLLALSIVYVTFGGSAWLEGLFFGLKAAVLAVVIEALLRIARRALKSGTAYALAAAAFVLIYALQVPFPLIVAGAGALGFLLPALRPAGGAPAAAGVAPWRPADSLRTLAVWGAVWAAPVVAVLASAGPGSTFATIATFFSTMAVVTFGGAYAVLAWVAQAAVETYGWLEPGQMLDGLALAETTPGPLILVLTFVGFLAAHGDPMGLDPILAGVLGATLTTWVTFAPCFLFIFLLAPHVERIAGRPALQGALAAITAAVVGVILNLAIWFALHVLFARVGTVAAGPLSFAWPDLASLDLRAALLAALAVLLLFRFHVGMLWTLAACGAGGLALRLLD
jgi:chromate transporter